jgi:hypothetical protein
MEQLIKILTDAFNLINLSDIKVDGIKNKENSLEKIFEEILLKNNCIKNNM